MKLIGFLLLEVILVCIGAIRIRPVSKAYYRNVLRRYGPRRPLPSQQYHWNNRGRPGGHLWQLRRFGRRPGFNPIPYVSQMYKC